MKLDLKKVSKSCLFLLILGFLGLFIAYSNGYSEQIAGDKVSLTNQKIEEFETDILNGENISLETYLTKEEDYSTKTSEASLKISSKFENLVDSGIKFIFRKLGSMIE